MTVQSHSSPSRDAPAHFMSEAQLDDFRDRLLSWRRDILDETRSTMRTLKDTDTPPDTTDQAALEVDRATDLRARDRQRKLLAKIDAAIARIDNGTYGYCLVTGNPIAIERLMARPIATMSIEAQEDHERKERTYRDR